MGGHGALTLFLRQPGRYRSVSAFAPIANPSKCPWGEKAFAGYLGKENKEAWKQYDATEVFIECRGKHHEVFAYYVHVYMIFLQVGCRLPASGAYLD